MTRRVANVVKDWRLSGLCAVLMVLFIVSPARSQTDIEPPLAGRPPEFSDIAGRYRITSQAEPTEVFVEEPLILKVRLTGQGPERYKPQRRHLQVFSPELLEQFHVEPLPERDTVHAAENTWEFVYRLRPRTSQVHAVPGLRLVYYLVSSNRRGYQTTYADPIPLIVKPKPRAEVPGLALKVLAAPERFYLLPDLNEVHRPTRLYATLTNVLLLLIVPPAICALGWLCWRRFFPNDHRRSQYLRSAAARKARRVLHRSAGTVTEALPVLSEYLRERLDLRVTEPTPHEIERFLWRSGVSASVRRSWKMHYQRGEETRFGRSHEAEDATWLARSDTLIADLEAEPCLTARR